MTSLGDNSLVAIFGYAVAFWLLSYPLRVMPTGIVYAIWSGMGIVLISAVAWIWYRQTLDLDREFDQLATRLLGRSESTS